MTLSDNVTYLPVEKLGRAIREGWERTQRGESDWIEGSIIVATNLYMARQSFPSDQAFGKWLRESKFGFFSKDDRSALIAMGFDTQVMREVLVKRTTNSYQLIYRAEKSRFRNPTKPTQATDTKKRKQYHTRKTERRGTTRIDRDLAMAIRKEKLGDTYAQIENTSLGGAEEMISLLTLRETSPQQAAALVERAKAGEPVSAVAVVAAIKQTPPVTAEQLIEAWKHCRILRFWLQATPEAQDALIAYQQNHRRK